jgi:hypothetical protein
MFDFLFGNKNTTSDAVAPTSDADSRQKVSDALCEKRKNYEWQLTSRLDMSDSERSDCERSLADITTQMGTLGISDGDYMAYMEKHPETRTA